MVCSALVPGRWCGVHARMPLVLLVPLAYGHLKEMKLPETSHSDVCLGTLEAGCFQTHDRLSYCDRH